MGELAWTPALVDYFVRGGSWMWALLACSVIALAIIIYKSITLWVAGRGARPLVADTIRLVEAGEMEQAARQASLSSSSVAAVLGSTLAAAQASFISPREAAAAAGAEEMASLEAGLPALSTVASIAPLIGFLGTVSGMIRAFTAIAEHGMGEPAIVAAGIGEALITTASGLIVAIPCFIAYSVFVARVNSIALSMEIAGSRVASMISGDEAA
ncbi:MAG: MotA/TolQ/ExbB proton channel family protein [candidate division WS1 bacterium]|jgi:biopolymer transport protein ExbB|nr:MotA/TolQ/ExbB proton channel family protein [candidate division WS1 bacterium]